MENEKEFKEWLETEALPKADMIGSYSGDYWSKLHEVIARAGIKPFYFWLDEKRKKEQTVSDAKAMNGLKQEYKAEFPPDINNDDQWGDWMGFANVNKDESIALKFNEGTGYEDVTVKPSGQYPAEGKAEKYYLTVGGSDFRIVKKKSKKTNKSYWGLQIKK